jgi:hypothetical protein
MYYVILVSSAGFLKQYIYIYIYIVERRAIKLLMNDELWTQIWMEEAVS